MRHTSIFLRFFAIVLIIIAFASRASATQWVPVEGQVMFDGTPLCAMVLANGQNVFSCSGDGSFKLSAPLDGNDQVTLFAFASGFASFRRNLTLQEAQYYVVNMERETDGRTLTVSANYRDAERANWSVVSGTAKFDGNPVCAMILANGQHMFSCGASLGNFHFEAPKDKQGNITLFVFASGFQPYEETGSSIKVYPLNDTGIVDCSDDYTNNLICPVATHPGQDAEYGRDVTHNDDSDGHAGFSFTKLDASGEPLLAGATSWSCVRDNVTGLIWEVKTDDGGLHDKDDRYNWYNTNPATNGGHTGYADDDGNICYGYYSGDTATFCNTQAYVARVNQAGWCGHKNWRMPAREELRSLLDYSIPYPGTTIDTRYFPDDSGWDWTPWSSSPDAYDSSCAWVLDFHHGYDATSSKGLRRYVRLVNCGQ